MKTGILNTFDVLKDLSFDDEIDLQWRNYDSPLHPELLEKQRESLIDTGIKIGQDETLKFIYLSDIADYEDIINETYNKIRVSDYKMSVCNEVFYTMKIEGAKTTLARTYEIHNGSPVQNCNKESEQMVLNGFKATKYLNLIPGNITKEKIFKLWKILVDGVCHNIHVQGSMWRNGDVWVGEHKGVEPEIIDACIDSLVSFCNSSIFGSHPLLKALLLHYAFEFIHPFCDGNGRAGRMLMNNYLINNGYENMKAVSVTKEIDRTRKQYDVAFVSSENRYADCTPFLLYGLEVIYAAIASVV